MLWLAWARLTRAIGFSIAGGLLLATCAWAQVTFTVNSTDDGVDADVTDGKCEIPPPAPANTCTLRAAVMQANRMANAGAIIMLPAGTYKLSIPASISDGEENGDLNLIVPAGYSPGPTAIMGAAAASTTIDAQGIDRILRIDAGRTVYISGVSMINGLRTTSSDGGGIANDGSLTLSNCIVSHNHAPAGSSSGGGIVNRGMLVATSVTFSDNHAGEFGFGGAVANAAGTVNLSHSMVSANTAYSGGGISHMSNGAFTLDTSTLADNTADGQGGGINSDSSSAALIVTSSTVSGNKASSGGGVYNNGLLYARNITISGNTATQNGGGFYNVFPGNGNFYNSTIVFNQADAVGNAGLGGGVFVDASNSGSIVNVRNTVVAGNTHSLSAIDDDCNGPVGFFSNNRIGTFVGCSFAAGSTGTVTYLTSLAEFGTLQNNGGPTRTHALVPPSSMINGGLGCVNQNGAHLATDQRGSPRPPSPASPLDSTCDIGAFEYNEIFPSEFELTL
jgi:CSLREA domain-containing protein